MPTQNITVPVPSIATGPQGVDPRLAAADYLETSVGRISQLGRGSGVTALLERTLKAVIKATRAAVAAEATEQPTEQPTERNT